MKGERKDKKRFLIIGIGSALVGILFAAIGFLLLAEQGLELCFYLCLGLAVICLVIEITTLFKAGRIQEEQQVRQYTSLTVTTLSELSRDSVLKTFQNQGFQFIDSEILLKKTPWRLGHVSCYARWIPARCDTDKELMDTLSSALDGVKAWEDRDKRLEKGHSCLLLFLELEHINDVVAQNVPAIEMELMLCSFTGPFPKEKRKTLVVVLVDRASQRGYFWSQPIGPNVYAHGCRLLKKYFT